MKFHKSRWHYWYAYLAIAVLVVLAIWFSDRAFDRWSWVCGSLSVVLLLVFEVLVFGERVVVDGEKIELKKGFFSKDVTSLSCKSVSNVSLRQSFLQSLLRFGTVEISTNSGDYVLECFMEPVRLQKALSKHLSHK